MDPKGPLIDAARFAKFAPKALPGTVEALEKAARKWKLTEPLVLAHWLGQSHVESRGFSTLVESLNYSVDGLLATFGRHRISEADARRLGRIDGVRGGQKVTIRPADQQAIANLVYGGRWGRQHLGNTEPNDGWDMRGSGFKQNTGRANIEESGYTAEQLRTDVNAAADAAAGFFVKHDCVPPARADDVPAVTLRVNGGDNGLPDRVAKTKAAKTVVGL